MLYRQLISVMNSRPLSITSSGRRSRGGGPPSHGVGAISYRCRAAWPQRAPAQTTPQAAAQNWPQRAVRIIVPYAPRIPGEGDIDCGALACAKSASLRQPEEDF
jgi:hypothetical protein